MLAKVLDKNYKKGSLKGLRVKEGRTNKRETHISLEKSRQKEGLRLKP